MPFPPFPQANPDHHPDQAKLHPLTIEEPGSCIIRHKEGQCVLFCFFMLINLGSTHNQC